MLKLKTLSKAKRESRLLFLEIPTKYFSTNLSTKIISLIFSIQTRSNGVFFFQDWNSPLIRCQNSGFPISNLNKKSWFLKENGVKKILRNDKDRLRKMRKLLFVKKYNFLVR